MVRLLEIEEGTTSSWRARKVGSCTSLMKPRSIRGGAQLAAGGRCCCRASCSRSSEIYLLLNQQVAEGRIFSLGCAIYAPMSVASPAAAHPVSVRRRGRAMAGS